MKGRMRQMLIWFGWGLAAASVVAGCINGLRECDFQWDPAKLLVMGDNPYVYSLEHRAVPYEGFMEPYVESNQFPSCLLLLAPFTLMPQLAASYVWEMFNLGFTVVFLVFFWKMFFAGTSFSKVFFWVPMLLLSGMPWRMLVGNGQHLMFSLAFFMPAVLCAKHGRHGLAGVLLALSAFKYTTIVPLAFIFVVRRWWKPIAIAMGIHAVATIGCGVWLGESPVALVVQSMKVGALLTGEGLSDLASLAKALGAVDIGTWANVGYCVFGAMLTVIAWVGCRDDLLLLSGLSVVSSVMFYHRAYDYVVLVFPLAYVLLHTDDASHPNRYVRWLVAANILWVFFLDKACGMLHLQIDTVVVTFTLEHALLAALLWLFAATRTADPKSASESGCGRWHGHAG